MLHVSVVPPLLISWWGCVTATQVAISNNCPFQILPDVAESNYRVLTDSVYFQCIVTFLSAEGHNQCIPLKLCGSMGFPDLLSRNKTCTKLDWYTVTAYVS